MPLRIQGKQKFLEKERLRTTKEERNDYVGKILEITGKKGFREEKKTGSLPRPERSDEQ